MIRDWLCLHSAVRQEFIPRDTRGRGPRIRKGLESCSERCEAKLEPSARRISYARLRSRTTDEPRPSLRIALKEKSWKRRGDRVVLAMIRCFTSQPSGKLLRRFPRKKKISAVTGGRRSADCSRHFPPCYSFGFNGHKSEEKTVKEETRLGKVESTEASQGCQDGARGGN